MAKYTQTLQEYCQSVYLGQQLQLNPSADYYSVITSMTENDYYTIVENYVLPSPLPFYNQSSIDKKEFIRDFTDRFLYFEIGQDSFAKFRQTLKSWLRQEMPYYGQLWQSQISSVEDIINNIDVITTRKGIVSDKEGTISSEGSVTYGKTQTDIFENKNTNSIVPLGSTGTEREINQQVNASKVAGNTSASTGTDSNGNTDTYALTDETDITETRKGHDGSDVAKAVEHYRALIIDLHTEIFEAMKKFGLFMLVW